MATHPLHLYHVNLEHVSAYRALEELVLQFGIFDTLSALHEIALNKYGECSLKESQDRIATIERKGE